MLSATAAPELTLMPDEVRRITLRAQGFLGAIPGRGIGARRASHGSRASSRSSGAVAAMLRRVGAVQLDTISVLARSHELAAYARLGPVPRAEIEQAYWDAAKPDAFEYWAHAACVLPIEQWPYFAFRRRALRARGQRWHEVSESACDKVLARLRAEGPLTATQLGGAKGGGPWWDWSEVKIATEWLLDIGEVICVRRTGWRRVYDLPERILPGELLGTELTDEQCLSRLAAVTARALGAATRADFTDYHRLGRVLNSLPGSAMDEAAAAAGLIPVRLLTAGRGRSGGPQSVPAWADPAALAGAGSAGRGRHRVTLLSPFDSLVWDRKRTLRVFGFEHSLEAYLPKHKRVHGYFAMPLLAAGRLAGRVDPARDGTTLVARRVTLEKASAAEPMARALREAARWVGCDDVRLEHVEPAEHGHRLAAALASSPG
ncbi:MAG: YcaQ family DNA glycosylase [Streptosporangiaceae bacterium]|nr:YcaQ family DNA glycosylase [Streptosporangiaceae bacterium]